MKTPKNSRRGFTLIELLVVIAALATLYVLFGPSLIGHSVRSPRIYCTNNLKEVGLAFRVWSVDHQDNFPMHSSATNSGITEAAASGNVALTFQVLSNELSTPKILFCPTDKKRTQAASFSQNGVPPLSNANVSYFVGLDAADILPDSFLSGDDNFLIGGVETKPGIQTIVTNTPIAWSETRHEKQGNIALADGSVQGLSSLALKAALKTTGLATNRLAMP